MESWIKWDESKVSCFEKAFLLAFDRGRWVANMYMYDVSVLV